MSRIMVISRKKEKPRTSSPSTEHVDRLADDDNVYVLAVATQGTRTLSLSLLCDALPLDAWWWVGGVVVVGVRE